MPLRLPRDATKWRAVQPFCGGEAEVSSVGKRRFKAVSVVQGLKEGQPKKRELAHMGIWALREGEGRGGLRVPSFCWLLTVG
jgi:hypothetical protein